MSASKTSSTKNKQIYPRKWFSWSQYNIWKREGPAGYVNKYIYGDERTNPAMQLGKLIHQMIESDKEQDDETLEQLRVFLPQYQHKEYQLPKLIEKTPEGAPFGCQCPKCKAKPLGIPIVFNGVPLMGVFDGFNEKPIHLAEVKTGKLWTQRMADEAMGGPGAQLTFYILLLHLALGIKPEKIKITLTWIPTEWRRGEMPAPNGNIENFETRRSMRDILNIGKDIVDTWKAIGKCCAEEFKSIGL